MKHPKLTKEEEKAIADLQALAKRWPKTLGIFSDGTLHVMKLGPDRQWVMKGGGRLERMDQDYIVCVINDIRTDGGDPW